ncbi:hypothetical protein CF319_g6718 [Tilletia indica]|nr:hypothetical protein CF319_g6718 [Tilletia indica]
MAGHPDFGHTSAQTEDPDQDVQPPIRTQTFDGIPDDASSATSDELEEDDMAVTKEAIKERRRVKKRRREKERRKRRKNEQQGPEDARRQALMKEVEERAESQRRAERERQEMLHFKEERLVEWLRDQKEWRINLGSQRLSKEPESQQLVEDEDEHQETCNSEWEADRTSSTELGPTAAALETPQVVYLDVDVTGASPASNDSETDPSLPTDLAGRTTITVTARTQNRVLGPIPRIVRRPVSKPNRYAKDGDIAEQVVLLAASTWPFTTTFSTGGSRTLECSRPTMHAQYFVCRLTLRNVRLELQFIESNTQ